MCKQLVSGDRRLGCISSNRLPSAKTLLKRGMCCALMIALVNSCTSLSYGVKILGDDNGASYSPARHDRFYSGPDKDFLGAALDLSGVARTLRPAGDPQEDRYVNWVNMISDTHFLSGHAFPRIDAEVTFYKNDSLDPSDPDYEIWVGTIVNRSAVESSCTSSCGLSVGEVTGKPGYSATPPDWVRRYPLIKRPESVDYLELEDVNPEIYVVGKDSNPNPKPGPLQNVVRVGRNKIDWASSGEIAFSNSTIDFAIDEAVASNGDSDGPSLTMLPGVGSTLVGIHWQKSSGSSLFFSYDASVSAYVDDILAEIPDTESVNVVTDLLGDVNLDFAVDSLDQGILLENWGSTSQLYAEGDLNLDGIVDGLDLGMLLGNFGQNLLGGSPQGVSALHGIAPEPSSLLLALLGLSAALGRRR